MCKQRLFLCFSKGFEIILKYFIKRGDVYLVDFGETVGSEQSGQRPAVVVQNDLGNLCSSTTIVLPLTSKEKVDMCVHTKFTLMGIPNTVLAEQIRTISEERFVLNEHNKPKYICTLSRAEMRKVDTALGMSIGLIPLPKKRNNK